MRYGAPEGRVRSLRNIRANLYRRTLRNGCVALVLLRRTTVNQSGLRYTHTKDLLRSIYLPIFTIHNNIRSYGARAQQDYLFLLTIFGPAAWGRSKDFVCADYLGAHAYRFSLLRSLSPVGLLGLMVGAAKQA